jgi:hypothetical protein
MTNEPAHQLCIQKHLGLHTHTQINNGHPGIDFTKQRFGR